MKLYNHESGDCARVRVRGDCRARETREKDFLRRENFSNLVNLVSLVFLTHKDHIPTNKENTILIYEFNEDEQTTELSSNF